MKIPFHRILIILLLVLLQPALSHAKTTDYDIAHNQHLNKVEKLPEVVKQVFDLNDIKSGVPAFIVDDFFDPERIKLRIELEVLFSLAIDLETDNSKLFPYGLKQTGNIHYILDRTKHPQWAVASHLFFDLSRPENFNEHRKAELLKKGFSHKDIEAIENYIHEKNINIQIDQLILEPLTDIEMFISQSPLTTTKAALALNYATKTLYKIEQQWFKWSQVLLSQFSRAKQQALINYAVDTLNVTDIIATPINQTSMENFAKRIESGLIRSQASERIDIMMSMLSTKEITIE